MKKNKDDRLPQLPRAPMPRQTGGYHRPLKGGRYNRNREKEETRRTIRDETS